MTVEFYIFNNCSYVDFYPIQYGLETCKSLHSFGPTKKEHFLFHYVVNGKGTLYDTDRQIKYSLQKGQGFLILPHHIYSYEADENNPWTYIWIEIDGLKAENLLKSAGLTETNPIFTSSFHPSESIVHRSLKNILTCQQERTSFIIGQLYLFADSLRCESETSVEIKHHDIKDIYIREAIRFVEQNYHKDISVENIAQHCNLNRNYFSRLFKEEMKISPQHFLIQYRMSQACELMKENQHNLSEIATLVGYSNQFNFSAAFKHHFKQSPTQWKKDNL